MATALVLVTIMRDQRKAEPNGKRRISPTRIMIMSTASLISTW